MTYVHSWSPYTLGVRIPMTYVHSWSPYTLGVRIPMTYVHSWSPYTLQAGYQWHVHSWSPYTLQAGYQWHVHSWSPDLDRVYEDLILSCHTYWNISCSRFTTVLYLFIHIPIYGTCYTRSQTRQMNWFAVGIWKSLFIHARWSTFGLGLLGFNASATARVIWRRWNDDDEINYLVEETGVPGGNHRLTASNWWNFSHIRLLPSPGIELGPQRCEAKWAKARWERRLSSPSYRGPALVEVVNNTQKVEKPVKYLINLP